MKKYYIYYITFLLLLTGFKASSQHDLYGVWAKRAAFGSNGNASISSSVVDEHGNVYISGIFTGTLNFSDDICNPVMRNASQNIGALFLIKYDKNGKYQWDVIFNAEGNDLHSLNIGNLYYNEGKIIFSGTFFHQLTASFPLKINAVGGINSKLISSPNSPDGNPSNRYCQTFLQLIDTETGKLKVSISELPTGTVYFYNPRIIGNDIIIAHYGWASIYASASPPATASSTYSAVASFALLNNDEDYSVNYLARTYPNQPLSQNPSNCDGSRVRQNITLTNGTQIFVHHAHDYTDNANGGRGTPAYYVMSYTQDLLNKNSEVLISDRAIDHNYIPKVEGDKNNNVFVMSNFGHSKYYNNQVDIENSNFINNYMGSGKNFETNDQHNKIALAKIKDDLNFDPSSSWAIQIGSSGTFGTDKVYGSDIKANDDKVYITGRFSGQNVPFGNGKTLSSNGGFDGFYAVYDNANGNCLYAVNIGGALDDNNTTLNLTSTTGQVLIGGNYLSTEFQPDPANRLYPLSGNGITSQGFIAMYSTDPASSPINYPSSFGDAPASYGLAVHHAYSCLSINNLDLDALQTVPEYSIDANTSANDDGISFSYMGDYIDLTSDQFKLDANGDLTAKIIVNNSTLTESAKILAWIDFNQNGVFDGASEASTVATVAPGMSGSVNLVWTGANDKLRNGVTYMRIRLTTDNIDEDQPSGLFFNGEVEDYKITLDLLELVKTAVSDNIVPSTADIGDTITYTIHLINKITGDIELFDPIPLYTKYIDSDPAATLANIDFYGQTVEALQWDLTNLQADENPQFTFRVVVTGRPAETDSIINIAYAVMNGDTLASAAANCHLAPVEVNRLWADYDYYAVWKNDSIMSAHISVNDTDPYRNFTRDSILTVEHGTAQLNEPRDGTLKYNSLTGFTGLDSLDYRLKALNDSVDSRAFFAVVAPYSNEYYACPGARVELGVFPDYTDTRITYEWYKNLTDVTPFANYPAPHITMGQNDTTFYLQVIINSTPAKNRLPLTVLLSDNCGTTDPAGCAVDGTLLFKEDFGGNSPNHPRVSTNPLNAGNLDEVYMQFQTSNENVDLNPAFFNYWILKTNKNQVGKSLADMGSSQEYWHTGFSDFTHPNDTTRGYMLMMDLHDNDADQIYETDLNGLCPGNQLYFSLRAVNLLIKGLPENNPYDAGIKMLVMDEHDNILASYNSGDIPRDNKGDLTWRLYGFAFTVPDNVSNIKFKIYDGPSGASEGNDFAIDDIEIRLCTPKIEFDGWDADTTVCVSSLFELSAEYNDGGYFGNDLLYRWEYSPSGDVNNPAEWSVIAASQGATNNGSVTLPQAAYTINKIKPADAGFYRFIVGNAGSIDNYLCRAMSPVIELAVLDYPEQYPDVRLQACAGVGNINLSAYIDTTGFENLQWYRESPVGPLPGTYNGVINTNEMVYPNTYVYKYDIENSCFTAQAKVFVKTLHEQSILLPPDSVVICYENAQNISLNQLFGLETGGIFTADADVMKYITRCAAPSLFEGAHVFNGKEAYLNLSGYNYTYKGDTAAKKITITYLITDTDSCLYGNGSNTYSVDIILTSVIGI